MRYPKNIIMNYLSHYVENKFSIYPEIKGCINRKTRLEDIFNFLKSCINYKVNKTKCWPNYKTIASKEAKKKNKNEK